MVDWQPSVLVLKLWLVLVPAIITVTNSKVAAAYDEHAKGKLEADPSGFINIDCGASEGYKDTETGLFYEPDAKYIDAGENHEIFPTIDFGYSHTQPRYTLRSFPQGKRNCYALRPKQGGNNNYLIRAVFEYGNYDNKNQTPKFKLYLGVNEWTIVGDNISKHEIIHVPSTEHIDVCLVNIGKGIPYISALELRPLDNSIYRIPNGALKGVYTFDLGGLLSIDLGGLHGYTRYPYDVDDRLWHPLNSDEWLLVLTNLTIYDQSTDDAAYKVPEQVLNTAVVPLLDAGLPLSLDLPLPYSDLQCYVYFHFAELDEKLKDGQKRKLRIDLFGEPNVSDFVTLEYLKPLTKALNYSPINGDVLSFSINAVDGHDRPPILNAFEVYDLLELPFSPTSLDDVNAMNDIKRMYKVTKNWQGDPCIPSNLSWIGLQCSNDDAPRITSLNLSSSNLTGEIPFALFNLKAITSLDLSCNNLVGPVPEFLAQLPNLKILNLTGNQLTGSVPETLLKKSRDGTLLLSVNENPALSLSASSHKLKKFLIPILGSILGVLLILLAFIILIQYRRKRKREMASGSKQRSRNQPFMYSEIISITDNFKNVIGEGDFGKVYYGILKDKTEVAVKVLSPSYRQVYKEFRAEVEHLMTVYHKNLVSLIGYCDDHENKVLIYEYMIKGNLRQHLSGIGTNVLSWNDRIQIAVDTAHGLNYLHNNCKPPIIHRDLKLSNILLTEKMQAKLTDFGLCTSAYLDPEFNAGGISKKKSDIYSFGIILFELITGQLARKGGSGSNKHILHWVAPEIERGNIQNIVDPRLRGELNMYVFRKIVRTAMLCVRSTAVERPDISNVLAELKECLAIEVASRRSSNTESSNTSTSYLLQHAFLNGGSVEMASSTR